MKSLYFRTAIRLKGSSYLSNLINEYCIKKEITLMDLAFKIDISYRLMMKIKNDKILPSEPVLYKLASCFEIDIKELIYNYYRDCRFLTGVSSISPESLWYTLTLMASGYKSNIFIHYYFEDRINSKMTDENTEEIHFEKSLNYYDKTFTSYNYIMQNNSNGPIIVDDWNELKEAYNIDVLSDFFFPDSKKASEITPFYTISVLQFGIFSAINANQNWKIGRRYKTKLEYHLVFSDEREKNKIEKLYTIYMKSSFNIILKFIYIPRQKPFDYVENKRVRWIRLLFHDFEKLAENRLCLEKLHMLIDKYNSSLKNILINSLNLLSDNELQEYYHLICHSRIGSIKRMSERYPKDYIMSVIEETFIDISMDNFFELGKHILYLFLFFNLEAGNALFNQLLPIISEFFEDKEIKDTLYETRKRMLKEY